MARGKVIQFRVSEYEFEQLRQEAEKQGVPMSDLLRKYVSRLPKPVIG
jgi:predicted DNA binding CopG/RHH family protein